jgi:RNA polymerase primary sigma factor
MAASGKESMGIPPATRQEPEQELIAAAEGGDEAARGRLVAAFMPLVGSMARQYRSSAVDRDELMQEGVVGLLRALQRYDAKLGTPFWAYASWWVRQAMQQLVAEMTRPVVLSDRALRRLARIKEARREFLQVHSRDPTIADLVAATDLTREQIERLLAVERAPRGLDELLTGDEGSSGTLGDLVADPVAEDAYERALQLANTESVGDLAAGLGERERLVVHAHFGLGRPARTLREIAGELHLSVERVRQIEEKALGKLREAAIWPSTP